MPRKNKTSYKTFTSTSATRNSHPSADGEVFRNFFAVNDDVDPRVSLQYVKEMFNGMVEEDVIHMIFSECAYDVDQTVETLFTLLNDRHGATSEHSFSQVVESSTVKKGYYKAGYTENEASGMLVQSSTLPVSSKQNHDSEVSFTELGASVSKFAHHSGVSKGTCAVEHHNPIGNVQNSSVENSKKDFIIADSMTFHDRYNYPVDRNNFKTYQGPDETGLPESSERKSPFYANSKMEKTWQNPPHNTSPLLLNTHASPHFITPFIPLRNKSTSAQDTLITSNSSSNGCKSWFSVSSRKQFTTAPTNVNDISSKIIDGHPVLVLLRGLPGSGKSSLAKDLKFSGVALSTDDFFNKRGKYKFDYRKLSEAHEWNKRRALNALQMGITPIIIDNTNTEAWEMLPYVKFAIQFNYEVYILEPNTPWKFKPSKLAKRNSHGVTRETIERMLERYDQTVTVESLKKMLKSSSGEQYRSSSSSERESVEKENLDDSSKEGTPVDIPNADRQQSSSSDSLLEVCGSQDSQFISSEVEVHKEQDSDDINSENSSETMNDTACLNDDKNLNKSSGNQDNMSELSVQRPCLQEWGEITDIDKLKLLMREGSEESQSCGLTQQSSDSSQEVSGWEAITEHDEDFFWSDGSFGSRNTVNAPSFDMSEGNLCNSDVMKSNNEDKNITLSEENQTIGSFVDAGLNLKAPSLLDHLLILRGEGNTTPAAHCHEPNKLIEDNWGTAEPEDVLRSWNEDTSLEERSNVENLSSEIKPQQKIFQNLYNCKVSDKSGEDTPASYPNATKCQDNSNSDVLLPSELDTDNWTMPIFECHDLNISWSVSETKKNSVSNASFGTQTEPYDFVLCHKLETNELFVASVKTLSSCASEDILDEAPYEREKIPLTLRLDKSTSTADIPQDVENSEKIINLKSCFPEILEDDLIHLLDMCHGDSSWLSSILSEWGYKYNMPNLNTESEPLPGVSKECMLETNKMEVGSYSCGSISQQLPNVAATTGSPDVQLTETKRNHDVAELEGKEALNLPLKLVLDQDLALGLQQLFGSVFENFTGGDIPQHLRTITLDHSLAQGLFNKWKECAGFSNPSKEVEECIEEKYSEAVCSGASVKNATKIDGKSVEEAYFSTFKEPKSLSEIMDMEYAIQLCRDEKLKKEKPNGNILAIRIKRMELHRMFPGVDTLALDDVFDSNNCNLENTLLALEADIGKPAKIVPKIPQGSAGKCNILEDFMSGNWTDWVHEDGFLNKEEFSSVDSTPEAEQWRAEAAMHYQIHQECTSKAKAAFHSGMRDVASFYSQKGNFHRMKFKAANKRASELIMQNRNACLDSQVLDLHGLYVQEAIPQLRKFLKISMEKMNSLTPSEQQPYAVTVITGRGAHSIRGAKLRPSVMSFLNSCGYRFDEINLGVFNISLSPSLP